MKLSIVAAAALSSGLTFAHPRHAYRPANGYNTTSSAVLPLGTGSVNCTSYAANGTLWDAAATSRNGTASDCGCTTAVTTTTMYVFAPDEISYFPTTNTADASTKTDGHTYYYSIVNGTTKWQDDRTPAPNAAPTTVYLTSTTWEVPPNVTSTAITFTATVQRTLTRTVSRASSIHTETVVVTETIATTTHITRPPSSTSNVALSTLANGAAGSASTTLTVGAQSSMETWSATSTTQASASEVAVASISTAVSGDIETSSSVADDIATITSSRTVTITGSRATTIVIPTSQTINVTVSRALTETTSLVSIATTEVTATEFLTEASTVTLPPPASEAGETIIVTFTRTLNLSSTSNTTASGTSKTTFASPSEETVFPTLTRNITITSTGAALTTLANGSVATAPASAGTETLFSTLTRTFIVNSTTIVTSAAEDVETVVATLTRNVTIGSPALGGTSEETVLVTASRNVTVITSRSAWAPATSTATSALTNSRSVIVNGSGSATSTRPIWIGASSGSTETFPSLSPTGTAGITYNGMDGSITTSASLPCATTTVSNGADTVTTTVTASSAPPTIFEPVSSSSIWSAFDINSTLANPAFTSRPVSTTSGPITSVGTETNSTKTSCTVFGSHTHASYNNLTLPVYSWITATSSVTTSSTLPMAENFTVGSSVATGGPNTSDISKATTKQSTTAHFSTSISMWSYNQAHTSSASGISVSTSGTGTSSRLDSITPTKTLGYAAPPPPYPTHMPNNGTAGNTTLGCGETGLFTINWDDEPLYVQDSEDDPPYAPVFNPYHHLFFANGFSYYAPDYSLTHPGTYDPVSGPNVAIYRVNPSITIDDRDDAVGMMLPGQIGAGPRAFDQAYWFDISSAALGCDNGGSSPCNMTISGYQWNQASQSERKTVVQYAQIPPCNQIEDCVLEHVALSNKFRGLSSIRFEAVVDGATLKSWVIDNLRGAWYDNSCEAGTKRASRKK